MILPDEDDGAGVGVADGAMTYDLKAATSLASSTVIIIGWPTFTSPVPNMTMRMMMMMKIVML